MKASLRRAALIEDEPALVAATIQGDAVAFRTLYARYQADLRRAVAKLVRDGPDREDVLQEVYLQLHRSLPRFRQEANFLTFARTIAWNVACDFLRKRGRDRLDYDSDALLVLVDSAQTPEEQSSARRQLRTLSDHISSLPAKRRAALLLVALEGLSLDDAADLTGASRAAIKSRIGCARRKLAELVGRAPAQRRPRTHPHSATAARLTIEPHGPKATR